MCHSKDFKILGKRLNQSQGLNPQKKTGITTTIVKCKQCNLIQSNPQPIPNNIQDHYGIPAEDYWKESYFELNNRDYDLLINLLNKFSNSQNNQKALDIGAGIGKFMIALENYGIAAWGIEPSESFYEKAIKRMNVNPNRLILSTLEDANYENNYFDFISFGAVLEHLHNPYIAIQKTLSWLKPGGLIHIEVPSSEWLTAKLYNAYYKIRGFDYVTNLSPMHEPFHLFEFSKKSFEYNSKLLNYEIVHTQYYVCDTYLPSILDIVVKPYMKKFNKGMQFEIWLRKK